MSQIIIITVNIYFNSLLYFLDNLRKSFYVVRLLDRCKSVRLRKIRIHERKLEIVVDTIKYVSKESLVGRALTVHYAKQHSL